MNTPANLSPAIGPAPSGDSVNPRAVTAVVCLALAAVVAAMSSLNVALPDIARSTHASGTQLTWIIDSYSLFFAALLLPAGALGDRFGRRRMLLIGLGIFGLGSAVAMTAQNAHQLIALRGVIGVGAALVMPATLSTITGTFDAAERAKGVSIWAGVAGASAIVGVLASGTLLEFWSWRSVFALNVVLAVAAIIGTVRIVPESADPSPGRLDVTGASIAVIGLFVTVYSIIEAPAHGWTSAQTLGGVALGALILGAFVRFELRSKNPMLDPRIFRHRGLSVGSLSIFVQFFAFFGFIFVVLQYLQLVRGDSPLVSALSMLPMAVTLMPAARLAPRLVGRVGTRTVCVSGLLLVAAGLFVLAQVDVTRSYWLILAGLLPLGAGMGAAMTPATTAITEALPASQQGVGSAVNDQTRELGGALGIAVDGSVLSSIYRNNFTVPAMSDVPQGAVANLAAKAEESFAIAAHLGGPIAQAGANAFVDGLHVALLICSGAALTVAVLVRLLLPKSQS
ncbi:MAG: qacA 3 [Nocardioidaceae bacterium]|nr:qacA 3 [Nocardioidaceae bacterium]